LQPATGVYTFMAQIFSSLYYGFFIYLAVYTGRDRGLTPKTGIAFLLVLIVAGLLFGDTMTSVLKDTATATDISIYAASWVYGLAYVGLFGFLCFLAGREEDGPVPDRLIDHG
jgi:hypothetical protein